jgi:fructokinase
MRILAAGEVLWDIFDDAEHLGGATLNFVVHALRLGHTAVLISGVGDDELGRRALRRMGQLGLDLSYIVTTPDHGTGTVTVKVGDGGQPTFTIHRPAAYDAVRLGEAEMSRVRALNPEWIYYGTLQHIYEPAMANLERLVEAFPDARRFYDVNLRRDCYTPELVERLLRLANVVKLNSDEAAMVNRIEGRAAGAIEEFCRSNSKRYGWQAVCVTRGGEGCSLLVGESYAEAAPYRVEVTDTVGAGDAFGAAFLHGLNLGWPAGEIGDFANRVGALVASRAGGTPEWTIEEARKLG